MVPHQQVLRLDVSVDDSFPVDEVEKVQHIQSDRLNQRFGNPFAVPDIGVSQPVRQARTKRLKDDPAACDSLLCPQDPFERANRGLDVLTEASQLRRLVSQGLPLHRK